MGTNKIDPRKIIKEIFGNRISLKTDFLIKLICYIVPLISVFEKQMRVLQEI